MVISRPSAAQTADGQILSVAMATKTSISTQSRAAQGKLVHCLSIKMMKKDARILTHLRLASLLWYIGKQNSPRCDASERGVPSGAILFAQRNFIEKSDKK